MKSITLSVGLVMAMASIFPMAFSSTALASSTQIPQFRALSKVAIATEVIRIQNSHRGITSNLLAQLQRPGLRNRAGAAIIYLLGNFHAQSAEKALLSRITFISVLKGLLNGINPAGFWGRRPAVNALISIGMPSVRAILKALPQETSALRRKLMVRVLVGVEGRAVTRFRLKRAIAKTPNAAAKANLKAALSDVATSVSRR